MMRATLIALLLSSGFAAHAQELTNCTAVRFARGQSSATVKGSVGSDEPIPCYALATGKGQTATFSFAKTNGNRLSVSTGSWKIAMHILSRPQPKYTSFLYFKPCVPRQSLLHS